MLSDHIFWPEGVLQFVQVSKKKGLIKDSDNVLLRESEDLESHNQQVANWSVLLA